MYYAIAYTVLIVFVDYVLFRNQSEVEKLTTKYSLQGTLSDHKSFSHWVRAQFYGTFLARA